MPEEETGSRRPAFDPEPIDVTPLSREALDDTDDRGRRAGWSRGRRAVVAAVLALALLGLGVVGVGAWRVASQRHATLETPPRVAGLVLDESERARSTADYLRDAFAAHIDLDESIGVVYADPNDHRRSVLLFGGTTLLWTPERDLDRLFEVVSDDAGAVTGLHKVDAGKLGGVMKCGTTTTGDSDGDLTVCGWADHGSVGIALFPGRGPEDAGGLLRRLRDGIQHRS